ncbi:MAG TPA: heme o synthase [Terriglobales bacterium]|nr:heme o synthase [Terriglobales bacterium]
MSSVTQPLAVPRAGITALARDYATLTKARVTTLIVMTAWAGAYFAAAKSGAPSLSWTLLHALLGIGLVSGGTAAINEVVERDVDALMRRTARRPLVTGSMGLLHASVIAFGMTAGGVFYLWASTNGLTAALAALTSLTYLGVYTPMKRVHPICTFLGAFPGAMPPVLGWTAIRGRLDWGALVLFAIVFFWQFPHFHSIGWLYREDYENARIRMLPVVESDGRSTAFAILMYALALVPVSLAPTLMGMAGWSYFVGALVLGLAMLWFSARMWTMKLAPAAASSKRRARQVLQASVLYLPLLFALMMINRA